MARTRRIKFADRDALHHVTLRVPGRQMLLAGADVKKDMLDALERTAEFSGVNVGAFALMDNHFRIVGQVPFRDGRVPEWRAQGVLTVSRGARRCARQQGAQRGLARSG